MTQFCHLFGYILQALTPRTHRHKDIGSGILSKAEHHLAVSLLTYYTVTILYNLPCAPLFHPLRSRRSLTR